MRKLITQFDNEKTKLSLATPTCGCCSCCCCCCIVSTFAAASISARSFGNYAEEKLPNEPKKIKRARRFGFWFPFGLLTSLGISLWLAAELEINAFVAMFVIGITYLIIATSLLKKRLNISGIASRVIIFSVLLCIFEYGGVFVGLKLVDLGLLYLLGAAIISILLICWAFGKNYDNLKDKNINSNNNKNNKANNQSDEKNIIEKSMDNTNNLINDSEKIESNKNVPKKKKKCPNCGTENAIDNKRCIYCSNFFEKDDEK
ncbi:MAG: hypothetical protein IKF71_02275 [Bacilli bacterium]|nr:hypothetical protein [Bacilli bacterium]